MKSEENEVRVLARATYDRGVETGLGTPRRIKVGSVGEFQIPR